MTTAANNPREIPAEYIRGGAAQFLDPWAQGLRSYKEIKQNPL